MEFIFGWGKSTIQGWTSRITKLIADVFVNFRKFPDHDDQQLMALEHVSHCRGTSLLEQYGKRINYGVTDGIRKVFRGAIGAIDGTFTICCSFPGDIQELMY